MEKIIIWGAGNTGKSAYWALKNRYKILSFVDSNEELWGEIIDGVPVLSPYILCKESSFDIKIIIASIYKNEIIEKLKCSEHYKLGIWEKGVIHRYLADEIRTSLYNRTIDLGDFLKRQAQIYCKEMAFIPGGSGILDYAFLKSVAEKFQCKKYLEIGTYIGESINILTDCCEVLYSVTAPLEAPYSMDNWCKIRDIPNYSERLTYDSKIKHIYTNSQTFDFSNIKEKIDLYFIDGDHSYDGVYKDTKNVFETKSEDAIVIWHDFRGRGFEYNTDVVCAVFDALGERFSNVFVTDCNLCGIYLPDSLIKEFKMKELKYETNRSLYTYDVELKNCQIK